MHGRSNPLRVEMDFLSLDIAHIDGGFSVCDLPRELFLSCCTSVTISAADSVSKALNLAKQKHLTISLNSFRFGEKQQSVYCNFDDAYLSLRDMVRLDSALTNRKLRTQYLSLIRGAHISIATVSHLYGSIEWNAMLQWMIARSLTVYHSSLIDSFNQPSDSLSRLLFSDCSMLHLSIGNHTRDSFPRVLKYLLGLERLMVLEFYYCHNLTTRLVRRVLSSCPSLQSLSLIACTHVNDSTLQVLSKSSVSKQLRVLSVAKCVVSARALTSLLSCCPSLLSLDISSSRFAVNSLVSFVNCLPHLQQLVANYIQLVSRNDVRSEIGDFMHSLARRPSLMSLSINNSFTLRAEDVSYLGEGCTQLRRLCIARGGLDDPSLLLISTRLTALEALDVRDCVLLSDNSVRAVIRMQNIRQVNFDGCVRLTGNAIVVVQRHNDSSPPSRFLEATFRQCPNIMATSFPTR